MEIKQKLKKLSFFQITCIILSAILIVAIIVQIGVIIGLKNKINNTKDKNEEIASESVLFDNLNEDILWQKNYINNINKILT